MKNVTYLKKLYFIPSIFAKNLFSKNIHMSYAGWLNIYKAFNGYKVYTDRERLCQYVQYYLHKTVLYLTFCDGSYLIHVVDNA